MSTETSPTSAGGPEASAWALDAKKAKRYKATFVELCRLAEKEKFEEANASRYKLRGPIIVDYFKKFELERTVLKKVWGLADRNQDGSLNLAEFCVAAQLLYCVKKKNFSIPDTLPRGLVESCEAQSPVLFGKRRPAPTVPSSSRLDGGENKDAPVASNTEGAEGIPDNGHGAKSRRRIASKKRGTSASPSGGATASPTSGGDANEEAGAASAVDLDRSRTKGGFFWDNVSNMWFNPDTQYYYNKDTKLYCKKHSGPFYQFDRQSRKLVKINSGNSPVPSARKGTGSSQAPSGSNGGVVAEKSAPASVDANTSENDAAIGSPREAALAFFSRDDSDSDSDTVKQKNTCAQAGGQALRHPARKAKTTARGRRCESEEDSDEEAAQNQPMNETLTSSDAATGLPAAVSSAKPTRRQSMKSGWEKHIMPSYGAHQPAECYYVRTDTGETVYERPQGYFEPGEERYEGPRIDFKRPMKDIFRSPLALQAPKTKALARRASVSRSNLVNDQSGVSMLHGILAVLHHIYSLEKGTNDLQKAAVTLPPGAMPVAELVADHVNFIYTENTIELLVSLVLPFFLGANTSPDQRVLVARVLAGMDHLLQIRAYNLDHLDEVHATPWWAVLEPSASGPSGSSGGSAGATGADDDGDSDDDEYDDDDDDDDDEEDTESGEENEQNVSASSAALLSPRRVLAQKSVPNPYFVFQQLLHDPNADRADDDSDDGFATRESSAVLTLGTIWKVVNVGLEETFLDPDGLEQDTVGQKAWLILARQTLAIQTVKLAETELPGPVLLQKIADLCVSDDSDVAYVAVEVAILVLSQCGLTASASNVGREESSAQPKPPPEPSAAMRVFCADRTFSRFLQGLLRVLNNQRYPFKRGAISEATIVRVVQILSFICTAGAEGASYRRSTASQSSSDIAAVSTVVLIPELYSNDRKVLLEILVREAGNLPATSNVLFFYIKLADTILTSYHDEVVKDCKPFFDALREMLVAGIRGIVVPAATLKIADRLLVNHDTLDYDDEEDEESNE